MTTIEVNSHPGTPPGAQNLVPVPRRKKEKAVVAEVVPAEHDVARFTQLTTEVVKLNQDLMLNGYQIAVRLSELREQKLYTFGGFATFAEYLVSISVSYQWANKMIRVAEQYTETDFLSVGVKKLAILLEAPVEVRNDLMEQARAGASRRTLETQVREVNAKLDSGLGRPKPTDENGTTVTTAHITAEHRVTLIAREGLYAQQLIDKESEEPATLDTVKTRPCFATLEFENGATGMLIVYLDQETGSLKTKVVFRRKET
jgi:hypothetical protein